MKRGEIRYASLGHPRGRRPVLVLTRTDLLPVLHSVTCAALTTSLRGIRSRLALGEQEGLKQPSDAICDQLLAVDTSDIDTVPLGALGAERLHELDRALAYALDIRKENLD